METSNKRIITVETTVNAPIEKIWKDWNDPVHIKRWYSASDDWHAPYADNDLRVNGKFTTTMAAKNGSMSFDFQGIYTNIEENKIIEYVLADGRKVKIVFTHADGMTKITETFDAESVNSLELQREGWQAILDNFKKYSEGN